MPSVQTKSNTIPQIFFNVSFAMQQPRSISPRLKSTHEVETSPKMDTNQRHYKRVAAELYRFEKLMKVVSKH